MSMFFILAANIGYLLGSIPFGLILCFLFGYGDIRKIGSGNIGATNVLRTGNKFLALLTLIGDSGKAILAFFIACILWGPIAGIIAGTFAVLGHNFPIWLKFKGGKGVAATLGFYCAAHLEVGLSVCLFWLATVLIFRFSSLAALVSLTLAPLVAWGFHQDALAIACLFLALLAWFTHRKNVVRLFNRTEPKVGKK